MKLLGGFRTHSGLGYSTTFQDLSAQLAALGGSAKLNVYCRLEANFLRVNPEGITWESVLPIEIFRITVLASNAESITD